MSAVTKSSWYNKKPGLETYMPVGTDLTCGQIPGQDILQTQHWAVRVLGLVSRDLGIRALELEHVSGDEEWRL